MTEITLQNLIIKPVFECICNCKHCEVRQNFYKKQKKITEERLDIHIIKKIFSEANKLGNKTLQISGGEPLLYKDLVEMIKEANKYNWFIFINSTGYGVTQEFAFKLLEAGLSAFNVSIDSPHNEIHDKLRGIEGLLKSSLNTLKIFNEIRESCSDYKDFYTNIQTIITRKNYEDIHYIVELAVKLQVSSIYFMYIYEDKENNFLMSTDQIDEFKKKIIPQILKVLSDNGMDRSIVSYAKLVLKDIFDTKYNTIENYTKGIYWKDLNTVLSLCDKPNKTAMILPNGNVLPCCMMEGSYNAIMGNIFESDLPEIWNNERYQMFRKNKADYCKSCPSLKNRTMGLVPTMLQQF
jgi:MoaA/NifB/PqqE/SkfB family radical SAM enzyme